MGKKGKPLHFKGSTFHRIIPQFMLQVWIFCLAALQAASALDSVVCIRSAGEVSRNAGCVLGCNLAPAYCGRGATSPTAWGLAASRSTARSSRRARPARLLPARSARRSTDDEDAAAALEQKRMGVAAALPSK